MVCGIAQANVPNGPSERSRCFYQLAAYLATFLHCLMHSQHRHCLDVEYKRTHKVAKESGNLDEYEVGVHRDSDNRIISSSDPSLAASC